jgi:hypothetical protein
MIPITHGIFGDAESAPSVFFIAVFYLLNKTRWRWLSGSTELAERPVETNGLRQAQATFPPKY